MPPNTRKFIASSDLFGGYEIDIDLNYCDSLHDIINTFYESLHNLLSYYNFYSLVNLVKRCKFHIHGFTYEEIVISDKHKLFYICDHC